MKLIIEAESINIEDLEVLQDYVAEFLNNNFSYDCDGQVLDTSFGKAIFTLKDE